jgi:plasmid stabilization system protein ParE
VSYTLRFLPEVEGDVMVAYDWYEDKAVGLGAEFLRGFYAHAAALQRTPLIFQKIHQDFRRGLLRRFPYACYYRVEGEFVIVYGAFHCARDPSTVNESLGVRRSR